MASWRPSPRKLKAITVAKIRTPGYDRQRRRLTRSAPARWSACCPSWPGAAGCRGRGSSGPIRSGSRCRSTAWSRRYRRDHVRQDVPAHDAGRAGAHRATAARTKSRSRTRERRAADQPRDAWSNRASATIRRIRQRLAASERASSAGRPSLVRSTAASTISSGRSGSAITASVRRIRKRVGAAADVARDQPDQRPEPGRGERADQADEQRDPAAVEQAQQQIAAELVGAERVRGGRRREAGQQVDRVRVEAEPGGHQRGAKAGQRQQRQQQAARQRQPVGGGSGAARGGRRGARPPASAAGRCSASRPRQSA